MEHPSIHSIVNMLVFALGRAALTYFCTINPVSLCFGFWEIKTKSEAYMLGTKLPVLPSYLPTIIF